MSDKKKNISVTSTLLSLIQFSRLLNNYILFSVHKVEGFQWQPPLSWIKAPKLYVRLDHGDPPTSFRTKETDFHISNWTDADQFMLWVITSQAYPRSKSESTVMVWMTTKCYNFLFAAAHFWDSVLYSGRLRLLIRIWLHSVLMSPTVGVL